MTHILSRAFSTLELMIALMIVTTSISGVVLVTLGLPYTIQNGHSEILAINKAQTLLNQAFSTGSASFSSVISISTSTSSDGFSTSLLVQTMPDNLTKYLYSTVSWVDSRGRTRYERLVSVLTDYADAQENSCSSVTSGDWLHPMVSKYEVSNYPASILAVDSSAHSNLLVSAATSTIRTTDPTIQLFDISSTTKPIKLGQLDNASSTKIGLSALAVHNKIIYAANFYSANYSNCTNSPTCSQLQIIDATQDSNPVILSNFQLATSTAPYASGSGGQSVGKSIFYANGYVYLGLQKTLTSSSTSLGEEFNIIDVHNSSAPKWLGGYRIGRTINQIQVLDGYAYLATDDPSRELVILDVRNPNNILLVNTYDAPGSSTFGYGEAISVSGTSVALGRSYTTTGPVLSFLNSSNLARLELFGTNLPTDSINSMSIRSVIIRGFLSFILTPTNLQIWNIQDRTKPTLYGSPVNLQMGIGSTLNSLVCKQNTMYAASETSPALASLLLIITPS